VYLTTTAFNFFMRETKDEWLEKNRPTHDLSKGSIFAAMTKAIASSWKTLSSEEADKYHKMAAHDSQRYKDEMEQYHTAEARMRRLTDGLAVKERLSGGGGEMKRPPGAKEDTSSIPSMIDTSHTSRADSAASVSRGQQQHLGSDPLAGLYQPGTAPLSAAAQGYQQLLMGGSGAAALGLDYGGESLVPWSSQQQQDLLVHDYLVEQQLQQRYAEQQRFIMGQQRASMAAEQRFMDQRALEQLYLEKRLRQQQQPPQAPQMLVPAYPAQGATLYYPSDPRLTLSSGGGMFLGNVGLAPTPSAFQQPMFMYAPSSQQQVMASLDGSLSGGGETQQQHQHQHQHQHQSTIRHEILRSLAEENAQQQALQLQQQLQGLSSSSLPPQYWNASTTVAPSASSFLSDRDRSTIIAAGVGGGGTGITRANVESETSRRLVRNLLQRPPPGAPSEEATATDESERSQSARGGRQQR
jgi:HMG-box domain